MRRGFSIIYFLPTLIVFLTVLNMVIPALSTSASHSFYWIKPGIYATYCSNPRVSVFFLKDIKVSDKIVYVVRRGYLAKMCFSWTILDVRDNLAYVNFTIILDDILKKGIEEWIPYALVEEPAPS